MIVSAIVVAPLVLAVDANDIPEDRSIDPPLLIPQQLPPQTGQICVDHWFQLLSSVS